MKHLKRFMIICKMIILWLFASFKNVWELVILVDPVNPNLSIYGALQNFDYSLDYLLITAIIAVGLFAGILKIGQLFKTNIYMLTGITIFGILITKEMQILQYNNFDDKFLITIVQFLMILFLGYLLLLNEENKSIEITFEYASLITIAIFGMLICLENAEGLIIFLGLEIQAFTFYTLVSLKQKNIFSAEGALKYFLIGAIASGMIILGIGLLYGQMAKTNFIEISELFPNELKFYAISLGGLLVISGLLFKIGAAPFHLWLPDAYQGAAFYVLIFLITFPKIILFYLLFTLNNIFQQDMVVFFACIASAIIGSVQAVVQTKFKRFLAFTIIFNNAFFTSLILLSGINAFMSLMESIMLYLMVSLTTTLCFFVLKNAQTNIRLLSLRDLVSLRKSNIYIAFIVILGFFSAAGIPPFIGFFQKYLVLFALTEKAQFFLMVFLIVASILPAFYYIRITKIVFFLEQSSYVLLKNINVNFSYIITTFAVSSILIFL